MPELKTPHDLLAYYLSLDRKMERIRERAREREEKLRADFAEKLARIAADEAAEIEACRAEKRQHSAAVFALVGGHPTGVHAGTHVLRVLPDGLLEVTESPVNSLELKFPSAEEKTPPPAPGRAE